MRSRPIIDLEWGASDTWLVWNIGGGAELAGSLGANSDIPDEFTTAVAAGIGALEGHHANQPGTWSAGVWLPDRQACEVAATLAIRVVDPDRPHRLTQEELIRWAGRPTRTRGVRVMDCAAVPGNLSAGPAVLQILETVTRPSRQVMLQMNWFVLPPGTDQIVLCQFDSEHPYLTDALGWETNVITDSLAVRLGGSVDTA
ncbi:hypothetical protein QUV83_09810 [Cellulomonas cellasea]|uniref:hypothetical protein n=1 Tax=Cellulomonas cellasea TaxID=43670 RepID=UPI0025A4827F|nr:hypothetical protein [Cellulomonas cellasea]MDM8085058.1 hypothetical protein [Cellulomonas cellasea]